MIVLTMANLFQAENIAQGVTSSNDLIKCSNRRIYKKKVLPYISISTHLHTHELIVND